MQWIVDAELNHLFWLSWHFEDEYLKCNAYLQRHRKGTDNLKQDTVLQKLVPSGWHKQYGTFIQS